MNDFVQKAGEEIEIVCDCYFGWMHRTGKSIENLIDRGHVRLKWYR